MVSLIDVTLPLAPGMPVWPDEPEPVLTPLSSIANGDPANVSRLSLGTHTGTHVDAPRHFIEGAKGAESLALSALCGPARVVRIQDRRSIGITELAQLPLDGVTRLLFQTRNGSLWNEPGFQKDFVYLEPGAAEWLVSRGVRLVGIDYLSIEQFDSQNYPVHHTLLAAGVVILEGLDLRSVTPGDYDLWCLPLKLVGADGAPARVLLSR
ncbi:MAG TPA: cyclase family protein [Gemmatimonadales bacterium]|jgi:arylformamidase|nr:cyclase family protein [Gemmatimonadales bacterium]